MRSRGTAKTNCPPHSRTCRSCRTISSAMFQGRTSTKCGRRSRSADGRQDRDRGPRHELTLLRRCGVANVGQQVGLDARVVEQRVAFGGGAVGRDLLAVAFLIDQEPEQVVLDRVGPRLEFAVEGERSHPASLFFGEHASTAADCALASFAWQPRRAGCRRAWAAPRRRRRAAPLPRISAAPYAATDRKSARGTQCRTALLDEAASGAETRA